MFDAGFTGMWFYRFGPLFFPLLIWEIVWKGLALWKAAQRKEKGWFIAILLLNTVGILPILYLYLSQKKNKS